jgi:hypothetical protein
MTTIKRKILARLHHHSVRDPYKDWASEDWFLDVATNDWGVTPLRMKHAITELIAEGKIKRGLHRYSPLDSFVVLKLA